MRYLTLWRPTDGEEGAAPDPEHMESMGKLVHEMMSKGSLLGTEPLAQRSAGARVAMSGGEITVTDETERMGGYAFIEAASREEAIELTKAFLKVAGDGVSEIRQVLDFGPPKA